MRASLLRGSVEDILPTHGAESFDACLSDPPYGLSFMGKAWDHGVPGAPVWAEVLRVLRPGAHVLAFGGTRTFHRLTVGIEDAGFEIRDCLAWLYGSGFPKSLDLGAAIDKSRGVQREVVSERANRASFDEEGEGGGGFQRGTIRVTAPATVDGMRWDGYGTALKPAWEPCVLGMKPTAGTFAANALRHGVAGLAIDAGRVGLDGKQEHWDRYEPSGRIGYGDTNGERRGPAYNPSGRWPANVLLDEVSAQVLDEQSAETVHGAGAPRMGSAEPRRTAPSTWQGPETSDTGEMHRFGDSGGASRFFYTAKADRSERQGSRHPTLKPLDLCAYLARLLLPPPRADGQPRRILVPFSGAGSEMIGCLRAGWDEVVGIEREAEYVADAERRIRSEFGLLAEIERAA